MLRRATAREERFRHEDVAAPDCRQLPGVPGRDGDEVLVLQVLRPGGREHANVYRGRVDGHQTQV